MWAITAILFAINLRSTSCSAAGYATLNNFIYNMLNLRTKCQLLVLLCNLC
jgi:hypothetical protein